MTINDIINGLKERNEPLPDEIVEAVEILIGKYKKADELKYVTNKLPWALYRTWRYFDSRERKGKSNDGERKS